MKSKMIVALVATMGFAFSANANSTSDFSRAEGKNGIASLGVFVDDALAISGVKNGSVTTGSDAVGALSFDFLKGSFTVSENAVLGTWTVSTETVGLGSDMVIGYGDQGTGVSAKTVKSVHGTTKGVSETGTAGKASTSGNNISDVYGAASGVLASAGSAKSKVGVEWSVNLALKAIKMTVNGSEVFADWSKVDVSENKDSKTGPNNLSQFVSEKFTSAIGSMTDSTTDASESMKGGGWLESGVTLSIVKASTDLLSVDDISGVETGSAKTGLLWVVLSAGTAASTDKVSDGGVYQGDYSGASEVLLMLPLQSGQNSSTVSVSTQKDDELGPGDLPGKKGPGKN